VLCDFRFSLSSISRVEAIAFSLEVDGRSEDLVEVSYGGLAEKHEVTA
jgi:hypothetical protein